MHKYGTFTAGLSSRLLMTMSRPLIAITIYGPLGRSDKNKTTDLEPTGLSYMYDVYHQHGCPCSQQPTTFFKVKFYIPHLAYYGPHTCIRYTAQIRGIIYSRKQLFLLLYSRGTKEMTTIKAQNNKYIFIL